MLIHHQGDLLESDCNVIAHGCNCFHIMGGGIARQIKLRYPEAYQADLQTKRGDRTKLGTFTYAQVGTRTICNLYTQYNLANYPDEVVVDYLACRRGFYALKDFLKPGDKLGIPRIGCGLAGGDWKIIEAQLERIMTHDVHVYSL